VTNHNCADFSSVRLTQPSAPHSWKTSVLPVAVTIVSEPCVELLKYPEIESKKEAVVSQEE
jgi:hypothetical protein